MDAKQVGEVLDKDPNAVYQLQHRALQRLRRLVLAGVIAAATAALIFAGIRASSSTVSVDNTPADQQSVPDTDQPPPETNDQTDEQSLALNPDVDGQDIASFENLSAIETNGDVDDGESSAGIGPATGDDGEAPISQPATANLDTETPQTTDPPQPSATADQTPDAAPTTTAPPAPVAAPAQATAMNICAPHQITPSFTAYKLYDPQSSAGLADAFVSPAAVRFVEQTGAVIHVVDTSAGMVTNDQPGANGWIGAGSGAGTFADFQSAPLRAYWGVLADSSETAGWSMIETQDPSTGEWTPVPGCE